MWYTSLWFIFFQYSYVCLWSSLFATCLFYWLWGLHHLFIQPSILVKWQGITCITLWKRLFLLSELHSCCWFDFPLWSSYVLVILVCCQWALIQLAPPPFPSSRCRVRLWIQDLLVVCVTYQFKYIFTYLLLSILRGIDLQDE